MTRIHLSDPIPLAILPESILRQLPALTRAPDSHLSELLREPGDAIAVVAWRRRRPPWRTGLVLGWATAESDGLLGCFVAPRWRRRGTGRSLVQELWPAACARWPLDPAAWHWIACEGSPGASFWRSLSAWAAENAGRWRPEEKRAVM